MSLDVAFGSNLEFQCGEYQYVGSQEDYEMPQKLQHKTMMNVLAFLAKSRLSMVLLAVAALLVFSVEGRADTIGIRNGMVSPDADRTHLFSATGNDYNGGGSTGGSAPAAGGTVTFILTPASLSGNTEASLFGSALVRQRGFDPDGSDKDPLVPAPGVPEPASMLLLGTALVGLAGFVRRRFRSGQ